MLRALIIAWCVAQSGLVLATTPQEKTQARAKVIEARQQYNLGAFDAALKAYQEVYKLTDDATQLFNIGQCQWKLGDNKAALHSYRAYLRSDSEPRNRQMVEARILELEERLKDAAQAPGAPQGPVASTPSGTPPATPAASGAGAPAAASVSPSPDLAPARPAPAALPLPRPESVAAQQQAVLSTAVPVREERPAIYTRWWFWTALGAVVAGAVVLAMVASSEGPTTPFCPDGASCGH